MPISAKTLKLLIDAGLAGDQLVCVVASIDHDMVSVLPTPSVDEQAARRRAKDRERQRVRRQSADSPQMSADAEQKAPLAPKNNIQTPIPPKNTLCDTKVSSSPKPPDETRLAFDEYNAFADQHGLSRAAKLTPARRTGIRARLKDCGGIEGWRHALSRVAATPGLMGQNDRGWRANLDFLCRESSFTKLMEGQYDQWKDRTNGTDRNDQRARDIEACKRTGVAFLEEIIADNEAIDDADHGVGGIREDEGNSDGWPVETISH